MSKTADTSFQGITSKFSKNIYATSKGRIRLAVLARDLKPLLEQPTTTPMRILDIGAGLGQVNHWFAAAGHQVMHTDIAAEMVAQAAQVHQQAGLGEQYQYLCAALQDLPTHLGEQKYDLVICHAVLEWLQDPQAAIAILKGFLSADGCLSLMFYNRDAKLFANTIYGNFDYVQNDLQVKKKVRLSPQQPIRPADMDAWLAAEQLQVLGKTGVRCFHDYLREPQRDQNADALLELELKYNREAPYQAMGRYQHWLIGRL